MPSLRWMLVSLVMLLLPLPAAASMTVKEYLIGETGDLKETDATNVVYVWGVMDALGVFDDAIRNNLGQTLFCVPPDAPELTVDRLKEEIDSEIAFARRRVVDFDAYAEQTTVGMLGLQVLSRIYDCAVKN